MNLKKYLSVGLIAAALVGALAYSDHAQSVKLAERRQQIQQEKLEQEQRVAEQKRYIEEHRAVEDERRAAEIEANRRNAEENRRKLEEQFGKNRELAQQHPQQEHVEQHPQQEEPEEVAIEQQAKQMRPQVESYVKSLPGTRDKVVLVRAGIKGVIVDCDYNFGDMDKETAKSAAVEVINDIMDAHLDCPFSSISVNCLNGKAPIGVIVRYEDGKFGFMP